MRPFLAVVVVVSWSAVAVPRLAQKPAADARVEALAALVQDKMRECPASPASLWASSRAAG